MYSDATRPGSGAAGVQAVGDNVCYVYFEIVTRMSPGGLVVCVPAHQAKQLLRRELSVGRGGEDCSQRSVNADIKHI